MGDVPSGPERVSVGAGARVVVLVMVCVAASHFNRISISVAGAEVLIPQRGIDAEWMGTVYFSYLLLYVTCMIPGGWFIDRFGPRTALMVVGFGSAVFAVLTGAVGAVVSSPLVLVGALALVRACFGSVNAPIHPGAARMVSLWFPPSARSIYNGLATAAACAGIAATYPVFGKMIDRFGWPGAFFVLAAATGLLAVVWTMLASDGRHRFHQRAYVAGDGSGTFAGTAAVSDPSSPTHVTQAPSASAGTRASLDAGFATCPTTRVAGEGQSGAGDGQGTDSLSERAPLTPRGRSEFVALLRNRNLLLLTVSYGALSYFQYLFFYWIQFYFEQVLGLDKDTARWNAAMLPLAMGAGMIGGGWLADVVTRRLGPRRGPAVIPMVGLLTGAAFLVLGLQVGDAQFKLGCFTVAMFGVGTAEAPYWTIATALGGHRGGTAAAILNTGGNVGGMIAPLVTPMLSRLLGWQHGMEVAALTCAFGAALWWWVDTTQPAADARREPS